MLAGLLVAAIVAAVATSGSGRLPIGHPVRGVVALVNASTPQDDIFAGQFCGGVLVGPREVLTAAHCVEGRGASSVQAVVGADNLCRGRAIDGIRVPVGAVRTHPAYDRANGAFDLALLTLRGALRRDWVRQLASGDAAGAPAIALGWGRGSPGGVPRCRLSAVPVRLEAQEDCLTWLAPVARAFDPASMLCAVTVGRNPDPCIGDSGGPLIQGLDVHQGPVLGVVSWGSGCDGTWPTVFSRADVRW